MADPTIPEEDAARKAAHNARDRARYADLMNDPERARAYKERVRIYNARRYIEKKTEIIAQRMAWAKANPEKSRANDRRSYQKHAKERLAQKREYYLANRERKLATEKALRDQKRGGPPRIPMTAEEKKAKECARLKKWREKNQEKIQTANREWREKNLDRARALTKLNKARRKGAKGRFTATDVERIRKSQNGRCAYCRIKITKNVIIHLDHIQPVSKGGTNFPANLQILCAACNLGKKDKDPIRFAQEKGFLI